MYHIPSTRNCFIPLCKNITQRMTFFTEMTSLYENDRIQRQRAQVKMKKNRTVLWNNEYGGTVLVKWFCSSIVLWKGTTWRFLMVTFKGLKDRNLVPLLIEILPDASPNKTWRLPPLTQNRKNRDRYFTYFVILNSNVRHTILTLNF